MAGRLVALLILLHNGEDAIAFDLASTGWVVSQHRSSAFTSLGRLRFVDIKIVSF